jgi:hypothetical protein
MLHEDRKRKEIEKITGANCALLFCCGKCKEENKIG